MSDCQAGHEKTLTGLAALLAGASTIYGPGMLESGMTFDVAQLVADNEFVAMSRYLRKGVPVNDETTFIDEIAAVGPAGEYLQRESTLKGFRALSTPKLLDRRVREAWEAAGSPDFHETSKNEAKRILREHSVEVLDGDIREEIRSIVAKADAQYAGEGPGA